jgi:carboxyl-terminal processing protease
MSRWNLAWLLGVCAVAFLGLSLSYSFSTTPVSIPDKHDNVRLLIDVMDQVQAYYVKPRDKKEMREFTEDMINGGLMKLDPHSAFYNAEELKEFKKHSEGKFGGVGIRIQVDSSGQVMVESPLVGTPAYKGGILAGDVIVKVDGKSTETLSSKEVADMIQGPPKTEVTLTVIREGETKEEDIKLQREEINIDSVIGDRPLTDAEQKWDYIIDEENRVAYIRLTAFTEETVAELTKVVQKLQDQGVKGLIVDLRANPGGLLRAAVQVSGMFLKEGQVVVSTESRTKKQTFDAHPPKGFGPPITNLPLVILINRYSASASEIVAAALQDHARAIIIGERSFGKGSVQNVIEMEGGTSALKLTTAKYVRPNGKNMHRFPNSKKEQDWGVKPDIEVKLDTKEFLDYFKYRRERDVLLTPGSKVHLDRNKKALVISTISSIGALASPLGQVPGLGTTGVVVDKTLGFTDRVLDTAMDVVLEKINKQNKQGAAATAPVQQLAKLPATLRQPLLYGEASNPRISFWCCEDSLLSSWLAAPNRRHEATGAPLYAQLTGPFDRSPAETAHYQLLG